MTAQSATLCIWTIWQLQQVLYELFRHVVCIDTSGSRRHNKREEEKKEKKKREKEKINLFFTLHFSFSLHLLQLPAAITMPTLHGKVAERVRGGCGRDTVYRFAPHPSQSSKGMEKRWKKIFNSIPRYNSCTHGRGTVDTCLSANTPLHRSKHCGSSRTYRLEKEALHSLRSEWFSNWSEFSLEIQTIYK